MSHGHGPAACQPLDLSVVHGLKGGGVGVGFLGVQIRDAAQDPVLDAGVGVGLAGVVHKAHV